MSKVLGEELRSLRLRILFRVVTQILLLSKRKSFLRFLLLQCNFFGVIHFASGVFPLLSRIVTVFSIFRLVLKGLLSLLSLVQVFMMFVLSGVPLRPHVFVVNVHYKCFMLEKRVIWNNFLMRKEMLGEDVWCVLWDFKCVCSITKRIGNDGCYRLDRSVICRGFSTFISLMDLIYLPLLGRNFIWFQSNGTVASRLDRILVSDGWYEVLGPMAQRDIPRDISNHLPIIISLLQLVVWSYTFQIL